MQELDHSLHDVDLVRRAVNVRTGILDTTRREHPVNRVGYLKTETRWSGPEGDFGRSELCLKLLALAPERSTFISVDRVHLHHGWGSELLPQKDQGAIEAYRCRTPPRRLASGSNLDLARDPRDL